MDDSRPERSNKKEGLLDCRARKEEGKEGKEEAAKSKEKIALTAFVGAEEPVVPWLQWCPEYGAVDRAWCIPCSLSLSFHPAVNTMP